MSDGLAIEVRVAGQLVEAELTPESVEALREALAPAPRPVSPYLNPQEAADLLRAERGVRRVYELVADGRLTRHGDGRRLLVSRGEVEAPASGSVAGR